jgi:UDP-N-acetylmuramate--alanine ligase
VATDTDQAPDLSLRRVAHIVGIGGPGMSAIAVVLADMGHTVSGSDVVESPAVERLRGLGIAVAIGHRAENIPADADFVAISTAVAADNLEVAVAREQGVPVVRRDSLLPAIAATRRTVAVAGTHGKTTTSSMLAVILRDSHLHPSFLIGGEVVQLATNAAWDVGDWFVLEADESDGSGFAVPHEALIVTNIEPDHLEFHGTVENLHDVFEEFIASTTGPCLVCADDPVASRLGRSHGARTYGLAADADIRMVDLEGTRAGSSFGVVMDSVPTGTIELPIAGAHNAVNACAALAMALELGVSFVDAATALAGFGGVGRRFEQRGEAGGITFIDDYAHLPTEIAAALSGRNRCGVTSPTRSSDRTCSCSPTSTPRVRRHVRGSPESCWSTRCSTAIRVSASRTFPIGPDWQHSSPDSSAAGTCASPSAPETSPASLTRSSPFSPREVRRDRGRGARGARRGAR